MASMVLKKVTYLLEVDGVEHTVTHELYWDKHLPTLWRTYVDGVEKEYRYSWLRGTERKPTKKQMENYIKKCC